MISSQYLIQTRELTKEFNEHKKDNGNLFQLFKKNRMLALDNINIQIQRSELICLLGLNGAGKTTLLKILAGILLPTKGEIYIDNIRLDCWRLLKEKVSFCNGDERGFYWRLTPKDNLKFFGALYGIASKNLEIRMEELFYWFGIDNPCKRFYEYSSGFKQRFCIIKALLHNPDILLLDEPWKNLDYITIKFLSNFIKEKLVCDQKRTVIISMSDLKNIEIFEKLIVLDKGSIMAQGNMEEVKNILRVSNFEEIFRQDVYE